MSLILAMKLMLKINIQNHFIIADLLTFISLFSGIMAVYFGFLGNFNYALTLIFISALLDVSDGMVARFLNQARPFGMYLDCMVDTIVFLCSIPIVLYMMGIHNLFYHILFIFCGVIRHARVMNNPTTKMKGVGSTIAGFLFPLLFFIHKFISFNLVVIYQILMILLSIGMVSKINFKYRPLFLKKLFFLC